MINVKETVIIKAPKETVWDFTQDYSKRHIWDKSVLEAVTLAEKPARIVKLKTKGNFTATFYYKLDDRPNKTSLAVKECSPGIISGGGGSWTYNRHAEGTEWIQVNTLILKNNLWGKLLQPFYSAFLKYNTRKAMNNAKKIIESGIN